MSEQFVNDIARFSCFVDLSYPLKREFFQRTYFVIRKNVVHFTKKNPYPFPPTFNV